jgi:predicted outer membrane repeat protein
LKRIAVLFLLWVCLGGPGARESRARTWQVNPGGTGDAPTVQAAIDSAESGDDILLASGSYTGVGNRDIDLKGKALTVHSSGGAAFTTIDCEGLGRGFLFTSDEANLSVISGLRIINGWHSLFGGAIYCVSASPTIEDNVFSGNHAGFRGGAVYCDTSSAVVTGNSFEGNDAACGGANFALDPEFCGIDGSGTYLLQADSPCAPGNTPVSQQCGQIGAFPVSCGTTTTKERTWGAIKARYQDE